MPLRVFQAEEITLPSLEAPPALTNLMTSSFHMGQDQIMCD